VTTTETRNLRRFFGLDIAGKECRLYLPAFSGLASLEPSRKSPARRSTATLPVRAFRYPGHTFAERDARAASYVSSLLSRAVELEDIEWREAAAFDPSRPGTVFLFGSRSNQGAEWATADTALGKFLHFDFGRTWSIHCPGGRVFSLRAPDKLSREEYEQETDYGVIGRLREPETHSSIFLIAGLGSRATEGSGYFLARRWRDLARTFGRNDFAVVLKFPPPIDPKKSEEVIAFDDDHPEGVSPNR
jgi:hypothetical protein